MRLKIFGKEITTSYDKKDRYWKLMTCSENTGYIHWIELHFKNTWLGLSYKPYSYYDPYKTIHFSFWFISVWLSFPFFKDKKHPRGEETDCSEAPEYGFRFWSEDTNSFFAEDVHVYLGKKSKIYDLPWSLQSVYRVYPHKNGDKYKIIYGYKDKRDNFRKITLSWIKDSDVFKDTYIVDNGYEYSYSDEEILKQMNYETFDFTHTCQSGDVQHTKAFAYEVKTIWRPKWFIWTKLFEKTIKAVEIIFERPVGDYDAWKGPTYSIYTPYKDGEKTIEDVVRREERTLVTH